MFDFALKIVAIEVAHKYIPERSADVISVNLQRARTLHARCYVFIGLFLFGALMQSFTVMMTKFAVGMLL